MYTLGFNSFCDECLKITWQTLYVSLENKILENSRDIDETREGVKDKSIKNIGTIP